MVSEAPMISNTRDYHHPTGNSILNMVVDFRGLNLKFFKALRRRLYR